jgi:peptide/nickel transport system permease protein
MAALDIDRVVAAPIRRRRRRGMGVVFWAAVAWILLVFGLAALADVLPLADPSRMSLLARRAAPSLLHLLGTDALGRDILSRLIHGARASLTIGLGAPLIGIVVGGAIGMVAGYFRGRGEMLIMGTIDVLLAFPPLVLALAITAYLGQSVLNLTLILALLSVPAATRVTRAVTLVVAQRDFVTAARALGASHARIMLRELLPNIAVPLLVYFLVAVAVIIVAEGALSFLGLGVPPPTPSWGSMIAEGRDSLDSAPSIAFIPAGAMFVTVLAFNLVGDTLRARADPRGRG